jgi:hypothetical protein
MSALSICFAFLISRESSSNFPVFAVRAVKKGLLHRGSFSVCLFTLQRCFLLS